MLKGRTKNTVVINISSWKDKKLMQTKFNDFKRYYKLFSQERV